MKKWIQLILISTLPGNWLPKRPLKNGVTPNSSSSIVRRVNFRINTSTRIDMLEPGDALSWTTPVFSLPPLWSKEEAWRPWSFSLLKIPVEIQVGGSRSMLNASRSGLVSALVLIRRSAVVTEELTHGAGIVRFWMPGIFLEVLESLIECHYRTISMKNWMTVNVIKRST